MKNTPQFKNFKNLKMQNRQCFDYSLSVHHFLQRQAYRLFQPCPTKNSKDI